MGFHKQVVDKLLIFDEETRNKAYIMYSELFYIKSVRNYVLALPIMIVFIAEVFAYISMVSNNSKFDPLIMIIIGILCYGIMRIIMKCSLQKNLDLMIEKVKFEISYNLEFLEIIQDISKFDKRLTGVVLMILRI